jgi:hypothetical protein
VAECPALRLADAIIAELPEAAAGSRQELELVTRSGDISDENALNYSYGRSKVDSIQCYAAVR